MLNRQPSSLDVYINTQYKSDHKPLNVDLTIQPLTCDKVTSAYTTTYGTNICVTDSTYLTEANALSGTALVTLINKRREKFRLDIANKLVIKNVTIDSLDSVLMSKDGLTMIQKLIPASRLEKGVAVLSLNRLMQLLE